MRVAMTVGTTPTGSDPTASAGAAKPPMYWRLLRLHHVHPNGWQRAIFVEGVLGLSLILVLADVASAWTLLVLPLASALIVKGHDVIAGLLRR